MILKDGMVDAERAADDGGDGSRAATTDEARALIRAAWLKESTDKRCKGSRSLYWACLFLAGCRAGEPEQWLWSDLHLDGPIPFVRWRKAIQKNRKQVEIALCPELAGLLRQHRASSPGFPDNSLVFPIVPPRQTFRADRDKAGIPALDSRGRGFSPHSARKWFSTAATAAGIPEKMVDFCMRHAGKVEARYFDPDLFEQRKWLERMPLLWPEARHAQNTEKSVDKTLTSGWSIPDTGGVTPMIRTPFISNEPPTPAKGHGVTTVGSTRVVGSGEVGAGEWHGEKNTSHFYEGSPSRTSGTITASTLASSLTSTPTTKPSTGPSRAGASIRPAWQQDGSPDACSTNSENPRGSSDLVSSMICSEMPSAGLTIDGAAVGDSPAGREPTTDSGAAAQSPRPDAPPSSLTRNPLTRAHAGHSFNKENANGEAIECRGGHRSEAGALRGGSDRPLSGGDSACRLRSTSNPNAQERDVDGGGVCRRGACEGWPREPKAGVDGCGLDSPVREVAPFTPLERELIRKLYRLLAIAIAGTAVAGSLAAASVPREVEIANVIGGQGR